MGRVVYKSLPDMSKARDRVSNPSVIFDKLEFSDFIKEYGKGKKFFIKTHGCQANVRDEEIMAGYLLLCGFCRTFEPSEADIAIINTCAVREGAEDKIYGEIGTFKANKKKNPNFILGVCGCMMQQEGVAEFLTKTYQHISLIFGTHNISRLIDLIEEHIKTKKVIVEVKSCAGDIIENLPSCRLDNFKASVNISYGCNKFCTYCIVPYTRGKERSRPIQEIINECKALVESGYKEITLLGQNVNSYGKDIPDGPNFAVLLEEIAKLGIPRLRFMTSHPWDFSDDMLQVIAKYPNIMKCIHLPVQSGSDNILKKMGRRYTSEEYLALVKKIKTTIPGVALTTDIIVGFPNESEEDFLGTLKVCEAVKYDQAFTFIYSPRKGTPAAAIKDDVTAETKHERFNRLIKLVEEHVVENSNKMIGNEYTVLVDGPSKKDSEILSGYTETSKMVNFKGPAYLKGCIVNVKITENHAFSMTGELLDDPIIVKAKELKTVIDKEPCVIEYLDLKNKISNDTDLKQIRSEILKIEKDLRTANSTKEIKDRLKELNEKYASHPLIINLSFVEEKVKDLMKTIVGELQ